MKEVYDIIVTIEDKEIRWMLKACIDKIIIVPNNELEFSRGVVFGMTSIAKAKKVLSEMDSKMINQIVSEYVNNRIKEEIRKAKQHKK